MSGNACGYVLVLDVTDRLAVIVGAGAVAARKARGLLEAGARRVRVVAPAFCDDFPVGVERVIGRYEPKHLEGAGLVFAVTDDPAVNRSVVADARRIGALVNRADGIMEEAQNESPANATTHEEKSDFRTPALLRAGPLTVAVSAGGSPALAAVVRDQIARQLDSRWPVLAEAMQTLRPLIRASGLPIARRRQIFHRLASAEALAVLTDGGSEGLRQWVEDQLRQ